MLVRILQHASRNQSRSRITRRSTHQAAIGSVGLTICREWHRSRTAVRAWLTGGTDQMAKRTTHRSSSGKKLYAVRDASGKFKDIQTYERAHRADLRKTSKGEKTAAKKR